MPSDVELGVQITKKGEGDKEAALGLKAVGRAADDTADELARLDRKLLETKALMAAAGKEFLKTGDISPLKALLKDERQLNQVRKSLSGVLQPLEEGEIVAQSFLTRFGNRVSSGIPEIGGISSGMSTALVAGAVVAGPAITAGLASAVLLGVGGATLAGGIVAAAHDQRVRSAWAEVGQTASEGLRDASDVFTRPLIESAGKFKAEFSNDVLPALAGDFNTLAPSVDRLTSGVIGLIHNALPGFNDLIRGSAPVINELADDLPRLGSGIGFFASQIGQAGPGAKDFIRDMVTLADATLTTTGLVINLGSKLYELGHIPGVGGVLQPLSDLQSKSGEVHKQFTLLKPAADDASVSLGKVGFNAGFTTDELGKLSGKLTATAVTTDSLAAMMTDKLLGATIGLDQATLGFAERQTSLGDVLKSNHSLSDISTTKGQQLREAVLGVVQANIAEYDAMVAAKGSTEEAAAAYDANTEALGRQLTKAGLTSAEVDKLIGKYKGVPANVNTDVQTKGLTEAINSLDDAIRLANNLNGRVSVITIEERHRITYDAGTPPSQFFRGLAQGGIIGGAATGVIATRPFIIGEKTLPEAAIPAPNSGISQARADSLLGTAASWWGRRLVPAGGGGGGAGITVNVYAGWGTNGTEVGQQVLEVLRSEIKLRGGNVQMILAGKQAQ